MLLTNDYYKCILMGTFREREGERGLGMAYKFCLGVHLVYNFLLIKTWREKERERREKREVRASKIKIRVYRNVSQ